MKPSKQRLPEGWTHAKLKGLALHYENQADNEAGAEFESAGEWILVPPERVEEVRKILQRGYKVVRAVSEGAPKYRPGRTPTDKKPQKRR